MLYAKTTMVYLQELVRKVYLEGLVNTAIVVFKNGRMTIEAVGIEDEQNVVDGTLTISVSYPIEISEEGEVTVSDLKDFLGKLELFERSDEVIITTNDKNQVVIDRDSPKQTLVYDLSDKKYVRSYPQGMTTKFGKPIVLTNDKGNKKELIFDAEATIEATKIKDLSSSVSKFKTLYTPIQIKGGKLTSVIKGETSSLLSEIGQGSEVISGEATSRYDKEFLKIIKQSIGNVTLRFSDNSPIHVHYEHDGMTADYLLQCYED